MAATTLAVAAVVVGAAGSYQAHKQSKAAAKDQEEAQQIANAEQKSQALEQRRVQIREERIRRAQILQSSENTGVGDSSGALGSVGALQTGLGASLASASRQEASADGISASLQRAADHQSKASEWQMIGSVGSSLFNLGGDLVKDSQTGTNPNKGYETQEKDLFSS